MLDPTRPLKCHHSPISFGLTRETLLQLANKGGQWLTDNECSVGLALDGPTAHLIRLIEASDFRAVTDLDTRFNRLLIAVGAYLAEPSDTTHADLLAEYQLTYPPVEDSDTAICAG